MDMKHWNITNEQLDGFKEIYKSLYKKSRQMDVSTQQQDMILDKLTDDLFMERLTKLVNEGMNISKQDSISFYNGIKEILAKWKKEFDGKG